VKSLGWLECHGGEGATISVSDGFTLGDSSLFCSGDLMEGACKHGGKLLVLVSRSGRLAANGMNDGWPRPLTYLRCRNVAKDRGSRVRLSRPGAQVLGAFFGPQVHQEFQNGNAGINGPAFGFA
jgi:hypothetical protein